ncbi:MAG: hypothetical protein QM576_11360 [Rhodopseudomonas sp.]|uniref:hypothetical protein n=1 Tax=Rhodopseudomonas sp. TaxID=1078 RepID=UPI0039E53C4A
MMALDEDEHIRNILQSEIVKQFPPVAERGVDAVSFSVVQRSFGAADRRAVRSGQARLP